MNLQPSAVRISGSSWLEEMRCANQMLRQGIRVLWTQRTIDQKQGVIPGTLIIPLDPSFDPALPSPQDLEPLAVQAKGIGVELMPLNDPAPMVAYPLRPIRIGLYGGGGAPFNHAGVLGEAGFPLRFLSDAQIRAGELATVDVFVMPGGGARAMQGQLEPLGIDGAQLLNQWVRNGNMYIGSCAGAYDCAISSPQFTASCPPKGALQLINARVWNGEGDGLGGEIDGLDSPGVGVLSVRVTHPDHPVMFGMPDEFDLVHYNGPVFDVLDSPEIEGASLAEGLAAFNGASERFTAAENFMGGTVHGDATLVERASTAGKYAAVAGELGTGRVVAFGSHPEFGFNLAMDEWGAPARMIANAALWQAASGSAHAQSWSYRETPGPISVPRGAALVQVQHLARQLSQDIANLRQRSIDALPRWLTSEYAMSVFGLSSVEIWQQSLDDIESLADRIGKQALHLGERMAAMGASDAEREIATQIDRWLLDERRAIWRQDGGYQGVTILLRTAHEMCTRAFDSWDIELGPPAGPYDYFDENPFHLVAGSYLAAVGCVAGATQLLRALTAEVNLVLRSSPSQLIPSA